MIAIYSGSVFGLIKFPILDPQEETHIESGIDIPEEYNKGKHGFKLCEVSLHAREWMLRDEYRELGKLRLCLSIGSEPIIEIPVQFILNGRKIDQEGGGEFPERVYRACGDFGLTIINPGSRPIWAKIVQPSVDRHWLTQPLSFDLKLTGPFCNPMPGG